MLFYNLGTGKKYEYDPDSISIPVHKDKPLPHSYLETFKKDSKGFKDALIYLMFLQGFVLETDYIT